jgi:hypothetical protein
VERHSRLRGATNSGDSMRKLISPTMHGVLDYATSAAVAAAPYAMDFPKPAKRLCEALALGYTGMSAMTDYPPSLKRAVPFKVHGATELAIAAALPAMPWVLGFADHKAARNLCFGLSAMTLVVAALTDWDSDEAD